MTVKLKVNRQGTDLSQLELFRGGFVPKMFSFGAVNCTSRVIQGNNCREERP